MLLLLLLDVVCLFDLLILERLGVLAADVSPTRDLLFCIGGVSAAVETLGNHLCTVTVLDLSGLSIGVRRDGLIPFSVVSWLRMCSCLVWWRESDDSRYQSDTNFLHIH
jgi:hypothetical protein